MLNNLNPSNTHTALTHSGSNSVVAEVEKQPNQDFI